MLAAISSRPVVIVGHLAHLADHPQAALAHRVPDPVGGAHVKAARRGVHVLGQQVLDAALERVTSPDPVQDVFQDADQRLAADVDRAVPHGPAHGLTRYQVQPPVIWKTGTPFRSTVSGPSKLLLAMMLVTFPELVLFSVAQ